MPNIFEDASKATEDLFEQEEQVVPAADEPIAEEPITEEPVQPEPPVEEPITEEPVQPESQEPAPEQTALDQAAQTAELAAQVASEKDAELQQMRQQLAEAMGMVEQLQGTVQELSRQNEEDIVEETLAPPVLDINALAFADEETVAQAQNKYAADMAEYNRQMFMKEFAPVIEQANEAKQAKEKNDIISALSQVPELQGISDMLPQLDRIIANNKALSSSDIPLDEKYITAYAIAKGVNSINTPPVAPKEPTTEELMNLYNSNPEFQEMVEKQRISQIKQSQQVPPFSASSGAVNAAPMIKEEPKGWDDASDRTRKLFGLA